MKLLTKEQAEFLKCSFYNKVIENVDDLQTSIERIINQCTEKEFPAFAMPVDIDFMPDGQVEVRKRGNNIMMYLKGSKSVIWNHENFKDFTSKCQSICEWINDQEQE